VIGQGVPSAWLEPAKRLEITEAPTLFGPVTCRIETPDSDTATIALEPPTRTTPSKIRLHLRHPQGRSIESVTEPDGEQLDVTIEGEVIHLPATKPLELIVKFAKS
jgi:hypothetical protein